MWLCLLTFGRQGCWEEPQGNGEQTEQAANCKEQKKHIGEIKESVCIVWAPPDIPRFACGCLALNSFQPRRRSWLVWNQAQPAGDESRRRGRHETSSSLLGGGLGNV